MTFPPAQGRKFVPIDDNPMDSPETNCGESMENPIMKSIQIRFTCKESSIGEFQKIAVLIV